MDEVDFRRILVELQYDEYEMRMVMKRVRHMKEIGGWRGPLYTTAVSK